MEEYFKMPLLEKMYQFQSEYFEEAVIKDIFESKRYFELQDIQDELWEKVKNMIDNKEKQKELMDTFKNIEIYIHNENEYWNKEYYKLGFTNGIELNIKGKDEVQIINKSKNSKKIIRKSDNSISIHNFLDKIRERKNKRCVKKRIIKTY